VKITVLRIAARDKKTGEQRFNRKTKAGGLRVVLLRKNPPPEREDKNPARENQKAAREGIKAEARIKNAVKPGFRNRNAAPRRQCKFRVKAKEEENGTAHRV